MEAIGTLAGGIAHDFNNLLMGIQGYTSLMLLDIDEAHPFHGRLRSIEQQVQSGAELTRQLLGFARGGKYEIVPTDLNDLVTRSLDMFGRTKKEITIHKKLTGDLYSVDIDRSQIEQVLLNLFVNAWHAMPAGGELYIETQNINIYPSYARMHLIEPGQYVRLSVTDTGVGMDEATKQRIFEPFFTTKEMGRGTGLGLASAYGIIKSHGGTIKVYSEEGKGATFNIYLPASEKRPLESREKSNLLLKGNETVLLVDDQEPILKVATDMLRSLGYTVITAQSGSEALVCYEKLRNDIALVILDMIMPGLSGAETFERLREINGEVCVILSSGYSLNGQAIHILERGCKSFIQKPFNIYELSQKIREVLDS
jgi:CheY-like chemotaxis protein